MINKFRLVKLNIDSNLSNDQVFFFNQIKPWIGFYSYKLKVGWQYTKRASSLKTDWVSLGIFSYLLSWSFLLLMLMVYFFLIYNPKPSHPMQNALFYFAK